MGVSRDRTSVALLVLIGTLALLGVGLISSAGAAGLQHFAVRQVQQLDIGAPSVRAYLDLHDSDGRPIGDLAGESLSATLGQWPAALTGLEPFDSAGQGVAYVFLVDISKSLSTELFRQMVASLDEWIGDLDPLDRAAIVAFGDSSVLVADFTNDPQTLQSALHSLGPTDNQTVLHQALIDALELSRRLDPDLPGRRAIVIFSDGKDEGSSLVAEDVLGRLREDPAPIYALGYSRLRDPAERQTFLNLLDRFASQSGGASYEVQQTRFADAYTAIRDSIGGVWVADFTCDKCQPDSTVQRLHVQVDLDGKVLADGGPVRLLPVIQTAAENPAGTGPITDSDTTRAKGQESPVSAPAGQTKAFSVGSWPLGGLSLWLLIGSAALLVFSAMVYRRSLANKRRAEAAARLVAEHRMYANAPLDPDLPPPGSAVRQPGPKPSSTMPGPVPSPQMPSPAIPSPQMPSSLRTEAPSESDKQSVPDQIQKMTDSGKLRMPKASKAVRLVVVRGSRQGKQYTVMVKGAVVVGQRSDSDCVLIDEPGVDAQQFELYFDGINLYIRNLSEIHPTLINGQTIAGRLEIRSDTLVGTETAILKVVFE